MTKPDSNLSREDVSVSQSQPRSESVPFPGGDPERAAVWRADLPEPMGVRGDPIMGSAFVSLVTFLWGQDEAHAAFCEASGLKRIPPATDPLSILVDAACRTDEANERYAVEFIAWAIRSHWGEEGSDASAQGEQP